MSFFLYLFLFLSVRTLPWEAEKELEERAARQSGEKNGKKALAQIRKENMNHLEKTAKWVKDKELQIMGRIACDAMRPLQEASSRALMAFGKGTAATLQFNAERACGLHIETCKEIMTLSRTSSIMKRCPYY